MATAQHDDMTPEISRLLDRAIELTNEELGGAPFPGRLTLDRPSMSSRDLVNRVRAMVRVRRYLDSMINTDAMLAVQQKATYAALGKAAGVSRARAHQMWPRQQLFSDGSA